MPYLPPPRRVGRAQGEELPVGGGSEGGQREGACCRWEGWEREGGIEVRERTGEEACGGEGVGRCEVGARERRYVQPEAERGREV